MSRGWTNASSSVTEQMLENGTKKNITDIDTAIPFQAGSGSHIIIAILLGTVTLVMVIICALLGIRKHRNRHKDETLQSEQMRDHPLTVLVDSHQPVQKESHQPDNRHFSVLPRELVQDITIRLSQEKTKGAWIKLARELGYALPVIEKMSENHPDNPMDFIMSDWPTNTTATIDMFVRALYQSGLSSVATDFFPSASNDLMRQYRCRTPSETESAGLIHPADIASSPA